MLAYFLYGFVIVAIVGYIAATELLWNLKPWLRWSGFGVLIAVAIAVLWQLSDPGGRLYFTDFTVGYYLAGQRVLQDPSTLYQKVDGELTFVNVPIIAFLFAPFAKLSEFNAVALLVVVGVLAVVAACYFSIRLTGATGWQRFAIVALFAVNGPLYYSIRVGNTTHFLLLLLLPAILYVWQQRNFAVGILLGIAALIKLPLMLFGIYFVFRGRWQAALGFGLALLAIVGASILVFGFQLHLTWLQECIQPFFGKPVGAFNVQSIDGLLVRLLGRGEAENWAPLEIDLTYKLIRYTVLSLLMGVVVWVLWRSQQAITPAAQTLELCLVLTLALVISPISWVHYYCLLLVPLFLYLGDQLTIPKKQSWLQGIALSALFVSLPFIYLTPKNPILSLLISRILNSHYLFGAMILIGIFLNARWQISKKAQPIAKQPNIST